MNRPARRDEAPSGLSGATIVAPSRATDGLNSLPQQASSRLARRFIPWLLGLVAVLTWHIARTLRAVWWSPLLAICALGLGRFLPLSRAYRLVFGPNWVVIYNGGFCRLAVTPATSRVPGAPRR